MMEEIPDPTTTDIKGEDTARLTQEGCSFTSGSNSKTCKVAIIGAGPAGLCAARHLFAPNSGFTGYVFEQAGDLGGTWLYSDATGKDRFGLPIHSTLYYDLWTNLPKETMAYPGFDYKDEDRSYLPASRVLQYLVDYADHYNLHQHIKLNHHVLRVAPVGNSWSVSVLELTTQIEHVSMFDAVMVCSGPNIIPVYPTVDGLARFSGRQIHSKEYRKASAFEGKRVLIIGLGPSGIDISFYLMPIAKQVTISHNMSKLDGFNLQSNVKIKPIVRSMQDKTVTFEDGTSEEVDVIIHCTGYTYHYPFLTKECGLIVDQYITPLHQHFINIEHPTMCLIGIPRKCPHTYMVDYQVRAFMNILRGNVALPSKETMLAEMEEERKKRAAEGQRKKDYHKMSSIRNEEYFKQLQELGGLDPIPPVILKIFNDAFTTAIKDFINFRKTTYRILDNENYSRISRKTSNTGVKFVEDQLKTNQEVQALENAVEIKEIDEVNIENNSKLTVVDEDEVVLKEEEKKEVERTQNKRLEEVVELTNGINLTEFKTETTMINCIDIRVKEEHITTESSQKESCEKIRVQAIVEVVPHDKENDNEENGKDSPDSIEEYPVDEDKVHGEEDPYVKTICGDEIVKIIQTEEGGGLLKKK